MADNKQPIVIKKIKKGGHAGAHGGAWKVAYADFVTAMMAFFLVMWLMGSDEETKAAIAHYFNHPNTPWKEGGDPKSNVVNPLGEKEGDGEALLTGANGQWPEDLIDRPQPQRDVMKENMTISKLIEQLLDGKVYGMDVTNDHVKFSLPETILFKPGSAELMPESKRHLDLLGGLLKNFNGYIKIEGYTDAKPMNGGTLQNNWMLSMGRATSVMAYFKQQHRIPEDKMIPVGGGDRNPIASGEDPSADVKNRRVEFTLSYTQKPE